MSDIDLVIIGAGATGIEFADHVRVCRGPSLRIGVIDDDPDIDHSKWLERGGSMLGDRAALRGLNAPYLVAVGDSVSIDELSALADAAGLEPAPPVIHPSVVLAPGARIGAGTVIYPQAALSTDVRVGRLCQIHLAVTLGHDTVLGDHCIVTPGANISGSCELGRNVFIGTGTAIVPQVAIGADTTVGAGSVVTGDLPSRVVAFGSPARVRREAPVPSSGETTDHRTI